MDAITLISVGLAVMGATFFFGGVTQPEWGFCLILLGVANTVYWAGTPKYKRAPPDLWLVLGVVAIVSWTAVQSRWFSLAPLRSVEYIFTNAAAGVMLLIGRELGWRFRRRIWVAIAPILLVAAMEGALGLIQFLTMRAGADGVVSATGTYPNRNHFAGLLEMALPLAVAGGVAFWRNDRKQWLGPAVMAAVSALLLFGTVVSLSRMGFLAALFGLLVLGILMLGGRRRAIAGAVTGTVLIAAFFLLPTDEWILRFASMTQAEDIASDSRALIWRDTLSLIRDHWMTGVGMGAFEPVFFAYKNVAPLYSVDYAHNDYMQYLAELGVVGFGIAAAILGRCLYWMTRGLGKSLLVAGAWASVAAMAAHSLVDFNLYIPANLMVLAWIIGTATAPALTEQQRAKSNQ